MTIFNHKYNLNYSKLTPLLASTGVKFSAQNQPVGAGNLLAITPLERARKSLAQNQAAPPPENPQPEFPDKPPRRPVRKTEVAQPTHTPEPRPERPRPNEQPPQQHTPAPRSSARRPSAATTAPRIKSRRAKRPPVIIATITGLLLSVIVLLAITGLYGAYCYSQGRHGDASVTASTAMYAVAVFVGCFWAAAVVRRQSKVPVIVICAVYLAVSLVISARLFSVADFKLLMIVQKILFTAVAGFAGYAISLIPYLIGRTRKRK